MKRVGKWIAVATATGGLWLGVAPAITPVQAGPEEWAIDTWETKDGLPENSATAMAQTPDGYLWFGTFKGLVRFDGVRFTVFDQSNTPELPSDGIVNLHLDRGNRLWVSTLAGLVWRDSGGWHLLHKAGSSADYVRTFAESPDGKLLLTTFGGNVVEFSENQMKQLPAPPGRSGEGYLAAADEDGCWWVAQHGFVGRWNGHAWEPMASTNDLAHLTSSQIGIAAAHDGTVWILLNEELRKYSHAKEEARVTLTQSPGNVWSMQEDSRGNLWIATIDEGVCQVSTDGTLVKWNEKSGVSYHGTRFVFEDHERNLWLGTSGGGLQRLKARRLRTFGPEHGLSERVVKSVSAGTEAGLWAATYGKGLFRWTGWGFTNVPLAGWTNRNLYVQSVLTDSKGRVWVGSYGPGLALLEGTRVQRFPTDQTGGDNVVALFEDKHGRIWISGGKGVSVYEGGRFRVCAPPPGAGTLANVCCFGQDSEGFIWLSNLEAVYRQNQDGLQEIKDLEHKSITHVTCLKGDESGAMWMGCTGAGLRRWKRGMISNVGVEAGLQVGNIHSITYDAGGAAWLTSNRGIMRVEKADLESVADGRSRTLSCQLLDGNDGLASGECPSGQQPVCVKDQLGRLWFATMKGVAMLDPARFRLNHLAPQAIIEEVVFRLRGGATPNTPTPSRRVTAPFSGSIELPAGCRGIEVYYTAPSFVSPEKVRFQIKLDGQDLDWLEAGNRRMAYFDELVPGQHVFQVRAANDDGVWDEKGTALTLTVLPFFWQTGAFRWLVVIGISVGALAWAYQLKAHFEKRRAAHETFTRQLIDYQESERKRVASELHDGIGQDLMLIKNRLALLTAAAPREMNHQLQEISATTTRTIAEVRSISHALRPSALEQVGLTKALEWMVEQISEVSASKFSTEFENIDGLFTPQMEINLYRIVQEALNNVLKHANASEVIVGVKREPDAVSVSVFDNGLGFEAEPTNGAETPPEGFGLVSMAERAKVLGGELKIQSSRGIGTRLTLSVRLRTPSSAKV